MPVNRWWFGIFLLFGMMLFVSSCTNKSDLDVDGDESNGGDSDSESVVDGDRDADQDGDQEKDNEKPQISRLRTRGMDIVDESGKVIVLKGVNLGGYLYHETWLTLVDYSVQTRAYAVAEEWELLADVKPVLESIGPWRIAGMVGVEDAEGGEIGEERWLQMLEEGLAGVGLDSEVVETYMTKLNSYLPDIYDDSDKPLFIKLEERFGTEIRDELLDIYIGAWIQENDIKWLSERGFNLVRVPIGYRTLTKGSHLEQPAELVWNEATFARIEKLLDWCETWGVYAIIDIQECPGGQNNYSGDALLYENALYQQLTVELWEELSDRLKERNIVAAYSLLAEPMQAPSAEARDMMYDKLVKAIRAKGDEHMLVIHDGFMAVTTFPQPENYGWENVIYSTHIFEWGARTYTDYKNVMGFYDLYFRKAQEKQNVPYFIGSFSTIWDEPWAYEAVAFTVDWYHQYNWSWSLWAYKRIEDPITRELWNDSSSWGLKSQLTTAFERPDVFRDDEETLRAKLGSYADLELEVNQRLLDALQTDLFRVGE
jgi:hypothetical protein